MLFLQHFAALGFFGLLVETIFTGIHNIVFRKDRLATGKTYLWMFFVWGSGGTTLEWIKDLTDTAPNRWWHTILRAALLTVVIYVFEFSWGFFFEHFPLTKRCPWKYMDPNNQEHTHKFSVMGFIRKDYAFWWFLLAAGFDLYGYRFIAIINAISKL